MSVIEVDRPQVTVPQVTERVVSESARIMDEIYPGWADLVDLDDFDIQDCRKCVLKYVFGSYGGGKIKLMDHGYNYLDFAFAGRLRNADWRLEIQARKTR